MKIAARVITVGLLLCLLALLAFGVIKKAPSDRIDSRLAEAKSSPVPKFRLRVLESKSTVTVPPNLKRAAADGWLSSGELRGQPTVVNFWASWCEPCRQEAGFLERTARLAIKDGVAFVGIDVLDITEKALSFMNEFSVSYLNVRDTSLDTAKRFGAKAMPETYFLSADGQIVGHVVGIIRAPQMIKGIQAAKSGRPMAVAEGGASRSVEDKLPEVETKVQEK